MGCFAFVSIVAVHGGNNLFSRTMTKPRLLNCIIWAVTETIAPLTQSLLNVDILFLVLLVPFLLLTPIGVCKCMTRTLERSVPPHLSVACTSQFGVAIALTTRAGTVEPRYYVPDKYDFQAITINMCSPLRNFIELVYFFPDNKFSQSTFFPTIGSRKVCFSRFWGCIFTVPRSKKSEKYALGGLARQHAYFLDARVPFRDRHWAGKNTPRSTG